MKKFVTISLFVFLVLFSCKKDEVNDDQQNQGFQIETGSVTNISNTSATVSGVLKNVSSLSISQYGHVWSTNQNPTIDLTTKTELGSSSTDRNFISSLTQLQRASTYYVRAYAMDEISITYGNESSFQTTESFFKFIVSNQYFNSNNFDLRDWILIYSQDGQLLYIQEIFNGNSYEFDWPGSSSSDKFMVQFFRKSIDLHDVHPDSYYCNVYLDVQPDVWYLGTEPETLLEPIGSNTIKLSDINLYDYEIVEARNKYTFGDYSQDQFEFSQYFNPDNIFMLYMNEDEAPYYKWIDQVGLNESYIFNSSDFTEMSDFIDIVFPQNNSDFVYIESEDNLQTDFWEYYMVFFNMDDNQSSVRAYYPGNLFSGYYTWLGTSTENTSEMMIKRRGAILAQFIPMGVDINVLNSSVLNFIASIDGSTDVIQPYWEYVLSENNETSEFVYSIYGSKNAVSNYSAPPLPDEIIELDESLLDLSKLEYYRTQFYEYDYYSGYDDYITNKYVQPGSLIQNVVEYSRKLVYPEGKKNKRENEDIEEITRIRQTQQSNR